MPWMECFNKDRKFAQALERWNDVERCGTMGSWNDGVTWNDGVRSCMERWGHGTMGSGLITVRLVIILVHMGAVIFSSDRRRDSGGRLKRLLSSRLSAKARIGRVSAFDHARRTLIDGSDCFEFCVRAGWWAGWWA